MKRPSVGTYVIGNPASALALFGLTVWLAWRWYNGDMPGFIPVIVGFVTMSAFSAFNRLKDYRHWKHEWNAMSGNSSEVGLFTRMRANHVARILVGGTLWCGFAYLAVYAANDPGAQVGAGLFWLGTLLIVAVWIFQRLRQVIRHRPRRENIQASVSQCLGVASQSPGLDSAFVSLPGYCNSLFR
jgi:hypothetical protein